MSRYRRRLRWNRIFAAVLVAVFAGTAVFLIHDSLNTLFPSATEEPSALKSTASSLPAEETVPERPGRLLQ